MQVLHRGVRSFGLLRRRILLLFPYSLLRYFFPVADSLILLFFFSLSAFSHCFTALFLPSLFFFLSLIFLRLVSAFPPVIVFSSYQHSVIFHTVFIPLLILLFFSCHSLTSCCYPFSCFSPFSSSFYHLSLSSCSNHVSAFITGTSA